MTLLKFTNICVKKTKRFQLARVKAIFFPSESNYKIGIQSINLKSKT